MYDECGDEGLTGDEFQEIIRDKFNDTWQKKDPKYFDSKEFEDAEFVEMLNFVIKNTN